MSKRDDERVGYIFGLVVVAILLSPFVVWVVSRG